MHKKIGGMILNYKDATGVINILENNLNVFKQIVIVDNYSNDNSIILISKYLEEKDLDNVILIESKENNGFAKGNNLGIEYLLDKYDLDYVVCINTDILIENELIKKCVNELEKNENIGLISTNMKEHNGEEGISAWKFPKFKHLLKMCFWLYRKKHNYNTPYKNINEDIIDVDVVRGSFMVFRASCLKEIDYFDPNTFLYYEENILGKKLNKKGYAVAYLPNDYYVHNHPKSRRQVVNMKAFKENLKSTAYYLKNYEGISMCYYLLFKLCSVYSIAEQLLVNTIKKIFIKGDK